MRIKIFTFAFLFLVIKSFSQETETLRVKHIYSEIQKGKIKPVFIASQNEPFWDIFIMGKYGIFYSPLKL